MLEFKFPDIGEGIAEGTLMKWLVKVGETVKEGQDIAEVETDKVTATIPVPYSGTISKLFFEEGDVIEVGQVMVTVDDGSGAPAAQEEAPREPTQDEVKTEKEEKEEVVEEETAGVVGEVVASSAEIPASTEGREASAPPKTTERVLATPVARKMASDLGVDLHALVGSGPGGRILKADIEKASQAPKAAEPAAAKAAPAAKAPTEGGETRTPVTRIRQTISERMVQSIQTLVHTTTMDEFEVGKLVKFREKWKNEFDDVKITYLPFIIKAVTVALREYPMFNSRLDMEAKEIVELHDLNIGIAVDTERGLMVPVLRNADRKSILQIARETHDLTSRAKENALDLSELQGGTFTVTNYGSIGGAYGIPIINAPEAAILGIGRLMDKPVVKEGAVVPGKVMPFSLSYDHRLIDGASGARFLNRVAELLQDPHRLLLEG